MDSEVKYIEAEVNRWVSGLQVEDLLFELDFNYEYQTYIDKVKETPLIVVENFGVYLVIIPIVGAMWTYDNGYWFEGPLFTLKETIPVRGSKFAVLTKIREAILRGGVI